MGQESQPRTFTTTDKVVRDDPDDRIIRLLVQDARATFASIGANVGLSPHAVAERVRRLQRLGAITGFTATIDEARTGRALEAYVDVRLAPTATPEAFEDAAAQLPSVRRIAFVTGRFDYVIRLACRDSHELDHTVRSLRRAGAPMTETRIVMRSRAVSPTT